MKILIAMLALSIYNSDGTFVTKEDYNTGRQMKDKTLVECNERLGKIKLEPIMSTAWAYKVTTDGRQKLYLDGIAIINKAYCKEINIPLE